MANAKFNDKVPYMQTLSAADLPPPRLGELITVRVTDGRELVNNETGLDFVPGADTLQTVTVNTLRRLAEGDLVRTL